MAGATRTAAAGGEAAAAGRWPALRYGGEALLALEAAEWRGRAGALALSSYRLLWFAPCAAAHCAAADARQERRLRHTRPLAHGGAPHAAPPLAAPPPGAGGVEWCGGACALAVPLACLERVRGRGAAALVQCKDGGSHRVLLAGREARRAFVRAVREAAAPRGPAGLFAFAWEAAGGGAGAGLARAAADAPFARLYCARREMARIGLGGAWRASDANSGWGLCRSYGGVLHVPAAVSDGLLARAAAFRSKQRLPVLCWRHRGSGAALARSSQPKVGVARKHSTADERLLLAIAGAGGGRRLLVLDARPKANAVANQVAGAGYESGARYPHCEVRFLAIANVHAVAAAFARLRDFLAAPGPAHGRPAAFAATGWPGLAASLLAGAALAADQLRAGVSVLVHCSDGWDRTTQLVALAQLLLDAHYRTFEGFMLLVEKEWLYAGHKFHSRAGNVAGEAGERSPIFLQFLDCVWQLTQQFPTAFEFNDEFLRELLLHSHSCRFGTFLLDCERQRQENDTASTTFSLWRQLYEQRAELLNPHYQRSVQTDCVDGAGELLLSPDCAAARIRVCGLLQSFAASAQEEAAALPEAEPSALPTVRAAGLLDACVIEHYTR